MDSLDALKLTTTFVHHLDPGGPATQAGLKKGSHEYHNYYNNSMHVISDFTGDVVHMVNEIGIIRSSVEEVEELLQQCGDELSLLVLPKEHDDLQFVSLEIPAFLQCIDQAALLMVCKHCSKLLPIATVP